MKQLNIDMLVALSIAKVPKKPKGIKIIINETYSYDVEKDSFLYNFILSEATKENKILTQKIKERLKQ